MASSPPLLIARGSRDVALLPQMANRHGLIAGATGTGKTVSLQVLAEQFSSIGVPVFLADVKGDLSGLSAPGSPSPKLSERIAKLGLGSDFEFRGCPTTFWDIHGQQGHPIRCTVSEMGPVLLSRLLELNETQTAVLSLVFKIADDAGWLLLDMKDLRAMVQHVGDNAREYTTSYGRISTASIGTIQRGVIAFEQQGVDVLFGEPALNIDDLMQTGAGGRGVVNILAADRLIQSPKVYGTFLLWLLSELFENLPEAGDLDKPRLVFFFDEAHLLFNDAPKVLTEKIEQVVRLIRSKGVGVYFISQSPLDVPDEVLGQLGNRVQHALRAFTPKDQKVVKAAAQTFRTNPAIDTETVITELGVGEALVSCLNADGTPGIVERGFICPPHSRIGPVDPDSLRSVIQSSVLYGHYEKEVDRESAYEQLKKRAESATVAAPAPQPSTSAPQPSRPAGRQPEGLVEAFAKSAARAVGSQLGRQVLRGVLGSLLNTGRRR